MKIRLGYVAIALSLNMTASKTLTYTHFQKLNNEKAKQKLDQIIRENFKALKEILHYNYQNGIHFYRMSQKLVPLATHQKVDFDYITPYKKEWAEIGALIKKYDMRVDMHPDQFCVLNSPKKIVYENTLAILNYCYQIFTAMKIKGKMVLHVGGAYEDKDKSLKRFIANFK